MQKIFTAADVREIIGLVIRAETGPVPSPTKLTTEGARALFGCLSIGDLRHWGAFAEVFAFTYDPDTLEVGSVVRTEDFVGNPQDDLVSQLQRREGDTLEIWGIRHAWSNSVAEPGRPECLNADGRRPKDKDGLRQVIEQAMEMRHSPGPSMRPR